MAAKPAATEKKTPKAKPVTGFAPMKLHDFTITQKRSGRYEVVNAKGKNVNGAEKEKLLLEAKLLKPSLPKAAAATETPAT
jgi:hypothetical protein